MKGKSTMKKYENVELELMMLADVITTSGPDEDDNGTEPDWDI